MSAVATQLNDAVAKHRAGQFDDAEAMYRAVLDDDQSNADARMLLGVLCGQTGRADDALEHLRAAARLRPNDGSILYNLGSMLRDSNQLDEAVTTLEAACRAAPGHASARFNLAATLIDLERTEESIDVLRETIRVEPAHHRAKNQLAILLHERGEPGEAAALLRSAIQDEPNQPDYHLNLGLAAMEDDRIDESIDAFARVTELAPNFGAGWSNHGAALRIAGRPHDAVASIERAIELDPDLFEARLNLVRTLLDLQRTSEANLVVRAMRDHFGDDWRVSLAHGRVMVQAGEYEVAERHFQHAVEIAGDQSIEPRVELGHLYRRTTRFEDAVRAYDAALQVDPINIDARLGLINVHLAQDDVDAANVVAEAIRADTPDDAAGMLTVCDCLRAAGRTDEAISQLAAAVESPRLNPAERCGFHFALARWLDKEKRYDEAWSHAAKGNALVPARFDGEAHANQCATVRRTYAREAQAARPVCASREPAPIFIVGMPRSGSSLIEQILSSHSKIAAAGEMSLLPRCAGRADSLVKGTHPLLERLAGATLDQLETLAEFATRELSDIASGCPLITEKSPGSLLWLGVADMLFPNGRVIFSERDPLDMCLSCYFTHFSGHHAYAYDLEDLGHCYREHVRLVEHWRASLRMKTMTLRYEDLVDDQERKTRELLDFCGVEWEERCLAFHENPRVVMTASIEQVRVPMYRSSLGRWRHYEQHLEPLRRLIEEAGRDEARR